MNILNVYRMKSIIRRKENNYFSHQVENLVSLPNIEITSLAMFMFLL